MLCRADLGSGRVTGEVIKRNSETVVIRLVGATAAFIPAGKVGRPIKRHIEKHHVTFEGDDGRDRT